MGLGDEGLRSRLVEVGGVHLEPHREPEPSVVQWPDPDPGRDLAAGDVEFALAGDHLERGVEARGVPDSEQHLGVGRAAGPAQRGMASYPQLELDRQLCFALYTASRAVVRTYGPLLDEVGLTYPQYVTMLVLWEEPERPRSVGELGERLHLDSGTLTPLLKRLAAMGYLTRARDADDERRVLVTLTADGLALRDRLAGVPESFLGCLDMDVAEAGALRDQLAALTTALEPLTR